MSLAIDRVAAKQKPSSGKGTVKDCHILCHALRLSELLEAGGYPRRRILVSSNRADFVDPSAKVFHPDIINDANAALDYAMPFRWKLLLSPTSRRPEKYPHQRKKVAGSPPCFHYRETSETRSRHQTG